MSVRRERLRMIAQAPIPTPELVFQPVLPELVLVAFGILGMLYEAFARRADRGIHLTIAVIGLAGAAVASVALWDWDGAAFVLGDTVAADRFSVVARVVLLAAAFVATLFYTSEAGEDPASFRGEFYPLLLFATAGMTLITAANDLILIFLALEIFSLSLYVLTGITGHRRANEAAMKYFLLGAFSSAFFLYGVAMAYGASVSTKVTEMAAALAGTTGSQVLALLAMAFLAIGFAFKVSAAPFHMWTPDVYQGAPTPVTAFMSAATKVAAFFALMRVFLVALQPLQLDWTPVIYTLAAVSILVGSVLAIAQKDVKRMLAYSSIAHAGFILTGLTNATSQGIRAGMFYLIAYAAMALGSFGVIMLVARGREERTTLEDYAGLAKTRPALAALMTVLLLSLAGIPPTAGFIAKVGVFSAAISAGHWGLVLLGVLASVAAAFFYLRVIVQMYMRPAPAEPAESEAGLPQVVVGILAVGLVVLGLFPGLVVGFIESASTLTW
ncbi:MAG TPA: NADH-quinone oxidoreductase subunit N [Actinomycetota bacterium]